MWFRALRENHKEQKEMMAEMKNLMEGQQKLIEKMVELETARIRRLEVPQPIHNSTTVNPEDTNNSDTETNNTQTNQNVIGEINQTFKNFTQTLESNKTKSKLNIKREYKLTQKGVSNVWLDYLHSELRSNDLLDIIDEKVRAPVNLDE